MRNEVLKILPILFSLLVSTASAPLQKETENILPEGETVVSQEAWANLEKSNYVAEESSLSTSEEKSWIQVYNHRTGETMTLTMDEYLQGVVSAEMQASYEIEALKAQAVAARTYVCYMQMEGKTHSGGAYVCTNHDCCQAWTAPDPDWAYYGKIREAVQSTQGVIITYEGKPILAMYFSSSGGYTEDYDAVWDGVPCAYLQSVPSKNEQAYNYTDSVFVQEFSSWTVLAELRAAGYDISCDSSQLVDSITNVVRSDTGRVMTMEIGGVEISGTKIRSCLGLRSTHFYFQKMADGGIAVVTVGYGHGVGMSQCGAAAMAAEGYSFTEILKYYYTGVTVEWMSLR